MSYNEKRPVIVNRCKWDLATKYGHHHTGSFLLTACDNLKIPYIDLEDLNATRGIFVRQIQDHNPIMYGGCGHGTPEKCTGQGGDPLLTKGDEEDGRLMAGRYGSFLSCYFALSADWFIERGMKAFFGYTIPWTFIAGTFPNDWAPGFFKAHYALDVAWAKGADNPGAQVASDVGYDELIASLPSWAARYAVANKQGRKFLYTTQEGPYTSPPSFKCCVCNEEFGSCLALTQHYWDVHMKEGVAKERSWICKLLGSLFGCPLS